MKRTNQIVRGLTLSVAAAMALSLSACQTTQKPNVSSLTGESKAEKSEKKLRLHQSTRGQHSYRAVND